MEHFPTTPDEKEKPSSKEIDFDTLTPEELERLELEQPTVFYRLLEKKSKEEFDAHYSKNPEGESKKVNLDNTPIKENPGHENWGRFQKFKEEKRPPTEKKKKKKKTAKRRPYPKNPLFDPFR